MPIRINLLAEAQAAEDVRRRDPAKRTAWGALIVVAAVLAWICVLQAQIIIVNSNLTTQLGKLNSMTNQYTTVVASETQLREVASKLTALNHFAGVRYLQATPLDALMRATVDGIQVIRLHTDQSIENLPDPKPGCAQKVKLVLDVKDSSSNPGNEQINKYKEALAATSYFQAEHISTNDIQLKNLGMAQIDTESGKPYVQFTLECVYPDKVYRQ
jgi:hypothetical protein